MMERKKTLDAKKKYSNCRIYSPQNKLMCINSEKKGRWYVEKTGAEILEINEDGTLKSIRLTFKPRGNGFDEDDVFGLSEQETRCVVTGIDDITQLTKHHIVPYSYRRHMPIEYKSRNHHDVVFMTEDKHDEYERIANSFRDFLHKHYGVLTIRESQQCNLEMLNSNLLKYMRQIRGFINSIRRNGNRIQIDRLKKMRAEILDYINRIYNVRIVALTDYWMERISLDIEEKCSQVKGIASIDSHKILVEKLITDGKLDDFVFQWRQHFIDTMQPPYMPKGWEVNRKTKIEII